MKKLIASRKLKRSCIYCDRGFEKGDIYYKHREVHEEDGEIFAFESLRCPKCHYRNERNLKRFMTFQEKCKHPTKFRDMQYSYIPGEAVKEPSHEICLLCGQRL